MTGSGEARWTIPPPHQPADDAWASPDEGHLCAVMDRSDADLAAGLTVPLADVLAGLDRVRLANLFRRC